MNLKRSWLLCVLMPGLLFALATCGGSGTEITQVVPTAVPPPPTEMAATPVAELPTPEPTSTSTTEPPTLGPTSTLTAAPPKDTATEPVTVVPTMEETSPTEDILDDLAQELFISLGGNGAFSFCSVAPAAEPLPTAEVNVPGYDFGQICLWGFPTGSAVRVELYDPSGQFVAAQEMAVDNEREGVGVLLFELSFAGQPRGDWALVANGAGMDLRAPLHVGASVAPVLNIIPPGADPFVGDRCRSCLMQNTYVVGDKLVIVGSGFPPDKRMPLGLYYLKAFDFTIPAQLIYGQEVQADEQGRFEIYQLVETLAVEGEGTYFAIISLDPEYRPGLSWHGAQDGGLPWISPQGAMASFVVTSGAGDTAP